MLRVFLLTMLINMKGEDVIVKDGDVVFVGKSYRICVIAAVNPLHHLQLLTLSVKMTHANMPPILLWMGERLMVHLLLKFAAMAVNIVMKNRVESVSRYLVIFLLIIGVAMVI